MKAILFLSLLFTALATAAALPANWLQLRTRWEYSHAVGAVLDLAALVSLILVALIRPMKPDPKRGL